MSNLGPLTTTYSASGANCNSVYQTNSNVLVYGTTSASISSCQPTSFVPFDGYYYSPGICPSGYTYACSAGLGDGGTAATCCPTSYQCRLGRDKADPAACGSTMQTDSSFSISQYISQDSGTVSSSITQYYEAGNIIFANGVVVRRASNDPAWHVSDSTTSRATIQSTSSASGPAQTGVNDGSDPNSGLTSGAKIGIGVGVSLGALLIFGIFMTAFLISKRKRRAAEAGVQQSHSGEQGAWEHKGDYTEVPLAELEEQRRHLELNANYEPRSPVELMN